MEDLLDPRAPVMAWDPAEDSTEAIVAGLRESGIDLDRDTFRAAARRAGSPSSLVQRWLDDRAAGGAAPGLPAGDRVSPVRTPPADPPGPVRADPLDAGQAGRADPPLEARLTAAAFELWRRWLPDVDCAETLAEEFDRNYEPLDTLMFGNPLALREALGRAQRVADACLPPGQPPDQDLFNEIWSHTWHDLALWLRCLPQVLARRGLLDEGIALCGRLALVFDGRAFLADRALLLAQAGRHEEARRQVAANVRAWRHDPTVLRKACEALWAMGSADEALLLYDEVLCALSGSGEAAPGREEMIP